MIRILMLNYEFPPLGGGSGNACFHLLKEFSHDSSLKVDLVTSGHGKRSERSRFAEAIEVHRLAVGKGQRDFWTATEIARWSCKAYRLAKRLSQERRYDLCHCWSGWPAGVVGYAVRGYQPYIVALRGSGVPGFNERLKRLDPLVFRHVSRVVWRHAAAVTAVSRSLRRLARRTVSDLRIRVIENGVDSTQFSPDGGGGPFTVLFVGRLVARKGVSYLLEAFAKLLGRAPSARLILAGEGPQRARLEALCGRLGIAGQVSFRGHVEHEDLPGLYRQASVFVLPALREGMSNALLEAMASGLAVVTTDDGVGELMQDSGLLVAKKSAEQIARQLVRYLRDPELRARHGRNGLAVARRMTWARKASSYVRLYEELLSGFRGAAGTAPDVAPRRLGRSTDVDEKIDLQQGIH